MELQGDRANTENEQDPSPVPIAKSIDTCTVELRFPKPPWETKIGSRNREARNIKDKITVKQVQEKQKFGSSNQGF